MQAELNLREVRAGDILEGGCFLWQNKIYVVLEQTEQWVEVREIMSAWTKNPHDRWQHSPNQIAESFRPDCFVMELVHFLSEFKP